LVLNIEYRQIDTLSLPLKFDCGVHDLNNYFHRHALQNHLTDIGKTIVAVVTGEKPVVVGFYTVSTSEMVRSRLPESHMKGLPRYRALPAVLLARLAVDKSFKGQGYGQKLLMHALNRAAGISKEVAVSMVVVDAKDDEAANFYKKYEFIPLEDNPNNLFLPMKIIRDLF
jgi:GNAT superfamily N-acetyltransferase